MFKPIAAACCRQAATRLAVPKYKIFHRMKYTKGRTCSPAQQVLFNPLLHEFPKKHDNKNSPDKIHPETQQNYTEINLLTISRILMKICICITYGTSWLLSTVTLYGYVSHMVQHGYCQHISR
jgi:hypothetical protein